MYVYFWPRMMNIFCFRHRMYMEIYDWIKIYSIQHWADSLHCRSRILAEAHHLCCRPKRVYQLSEYYLKCSMVYLFESWASCQIRKIVGCACDGNAGNVFPATRVSDPDMHHGTCVTLVPWCMLGSLTSSFLWSRWRGKPSRQSQRMCNQQFYISGKRSIAVFFQQLHFWLVTFWKVYYLSSFL